MFHQGEAAYYQDIECCMISEVTTKAFDIIENQAV